MVTVSILPGMYYMYYKHVIYIISKNFIKKKVEKTRIKQYT